MAESLTVLHVDTEKGWRGGQQQAAYLIAHLGQLGVRSVLACAPGEALQRHAEQAGWNVVPVRGLLTGGWTLARLARSRRIDVIHAHSSRAHTLALLVNLLAPAARVVISRRVDFHRHGGPWDAWKYRTSRVSRWIAISRRVQEVLIEDGVPAARIALIHSGIDTERIASAAPGSQARAALRLQCGAREGEVLVGSVGALTPHKDRLTLVRGIAEALRQGAPLRLAIAGEGTERARLEREIAALGLAERVRLLGQREDVPRLLHAFDLFALTSVEEGLGTSVLDAMAAGLPVVATLAGGLPEIVRDGRNGRVVPARDPFRAGQALAELARDDAFRAACAARNRLDVQEFSARRTAERTLEEYRRLLAR